MKTNFKLLVFLVMATLMFFFAACKKSTPPTVTISDNISVTQTSANVTGEVTNEGSSSVTERGFVYGKQGESRQDTMYCGSGMGEFPTRLTGLEPNTTYNCSAFAKNDGGIGTSGKVTFTTRDHNLPIVSTSEVENVGTTTASCGGNITDDGGAEVTERGICWGTNHSPSMSGSHASAGSGLGGYSCNMTNLAGGTTYYVRAYAKNVKGVAYGEEKTFTTLDFDLPEVTTAEVTNITQTSAKGGGNVTSDGGITVTERGICWDTNHNPTIRDQVATSGTGTGSYNCNIAGLNAHTTYYVRAYATNNKGTAYGEEVSFNTSANPPTVSTGSVTNITTSSATGSGNVTSDGGSTVTERGLCWSTNHNPSTGGQHVAAGNGTGEFTAAMTHLNTNTTYYVRSYATNGAGTIYGEEVEFMTRSISEPGVTTASVTNIGNTTATGGGNVISSGGAIVTERGICWSTNHNPTISGSHNYNGTGTGEYTVNLSNLTPNTTYYVRAYAINSEGTAYGEEVNFKTSLTPTYTIAVSANPSGSGSVTGGGTYEQGQSCTVTATAATGYNFQRWTENGQQVSNNASYTFNVTGNRTLVAQFQAQSYTISASANPSNGGNVSGGGTYQQGQSCTVHATVNSGYTFTNWTENGNVVSTNANYTFTVTSNRTLIAHFQQQSYTISTNVNPSGSGSVTGGGTYYYGQSCTLTANTNNGYTFSHWQDSNTSNPRTITVTGNTTYTAYFNSQPQTPTGAISGVFSVEPTTYVHFSQGNLQYQASTQTWKFAVHQYDVVGSANNDISQTNSGWIDLFGWGTSGWNCGNTYYHPWDSNNSNSLYGPPGNNNLSGSYANSDWGRYNAISNGGNSTGQWRTLTSSEWSYVLFYRNTASGIRYAKAQVAGVNGVILLPDDWSTSIYSLSNTNSSEASFSSNVISASQWSNLENAGAVFLPAAGYRYEASVYNVGESGNYSSTSYCNSYDAYNVIFNSGSLVTNCYGRCGGRSVRLVCPAE